MRYIINYNKFESIMIIGVSTFIDCILALLFNKKVKKNFSEITKKGYINISLAKPMISQCGRFTSLDLYKNRIFVITRVPELERSCLWGS